MGILLLVLCLLFGICCFVNLRPTEVSDDIQTCPGAPTANQSLKTATGALVAVVQVGIHEGWQSL